MLHRNSLASIDLNCQRYIRADSQRLKMWDDEITCSPWPRLPGELHYRYRHNLVDMTASIMFTSLIRSLIELILTVLTHWPLMVRETSYTSYRVRAILILLSSCRTVVSSFHAKTS